MGDLEKMIEQMRITSMVIRIAFYVVISFFLPISIPFLCILFNMFLMPFLHKSDVLLANIIEYLYMFFRVSFYVPVGIFIIPAALICGVLGALLDLSCFAVFSRTKFFERINHLLGGLYGR